MYVDSIPALQSSMLTIPARASSQRSNPRNEPSSPAACRHGRRTHKATRLLCPIRHHYRNGARLLYLHHDQRLLPPGKPPLLRRRTPRILRLHLLRPHLTRLRHRTRSIQRPLHDPRDPHPKHSQHHHQSRKRKGHRNGHQARSLLPPHPSKHLPPPRGPHPSAPPS